MSKSSQDEGAAESVGQEAPAGGPSKKTPADIYETPGGSKKIIRVVTVLAYMFSVSFVGILLSAYYVFLWQPPNPRLLHKAQIQADPQFQFLVDTQPASPLLVSNRTRNSDDKIISSGEDHQEAVQKATTFAQAPLKSNTRKFSLYPSSSSDRKHTNLNKSDDGSHRAKEDAGLAWRSSRAEHLTESRNQSRVSLGNILQRSTVKTQNIKRTNETFNMVQFVKEKNESALPVTFFNKNDEIRRINEIKLNFTNSDDFNARSLKNSSSQNSTFNQLDELEGSLNETEVNFPEDPQEDLPNPPHSEDKEITGPPDASPIEPNFITESKISNKLKIENTNDSYTENRTNNDEIRRINEIKVNFTNSDDFNARSLKNSSSQNSTFNQLDEPEGSLNETEVNFPEDPQDLPNPPHSEDNETTGPSDASPIEPKMITESKISNKLTEENTKDSYTENRTVSIYSIETLVNGTKATESSGIDDLTMSSTESAQSVIPLQNDLKILRHPEDRTLTKTTFETVSTFGTARTETEDSTENSETTDKNR